MRPCYPVFFRALENEEKNTGRNLISLWRKQEKLPNRYYTYIVQPCCTNFESGMQKKALVKVDKRLLKRMKEVGGMDKRVAAILSIPLLISSLFLFSQGCWQTSMLRDPCKSRNDFADYHRMVSRGFRTLLPIWNIRSFYWGPTSRTGWRSYFSVRKRCRKAISG